MGITNIIKGQSLHMGGSEDAFAGLCSVLDQPIAEAGTAQSVTLDQVMSHVEQFEHSTSVNNDQIVMPQGLATLETHVELQIENGASNNTLVVWTELKEGSGAWTPVPGSASQALMPPNTSLVISHQRSIPLIASIRTIVRLRIQGDSTNLSLAATVAGGGISAIPSAVVSLRAH